MQQRPILKLRKGLCYFFGLITKDPAPCFRPPPEHLTGLMAVKILYIAYVSPTLSFFPYPGRGWGSHARAQAGKTTTPKEYHFSGYISSPIIFPYGYISSPAPRSTDEAECSLYSLPSPKRKPDLSMLRSLRSLRCAASTARALRPLAVQALCNLVSWCSRQSGSAALAGCSPLSSPGNNRNVGNLRSLRIGGMKLLPLCKLSASASASLAASPGFAHTVCNI